MYLQNIHCILSTYIISQAADILEFLLIFVFKFFNFLLSWYQFVHIKERYESAYNTNDLQNVEVGEVFFRDMHEVVVDYHAHHSPQLEHIEVHYRMREGEHHSLNPMRNYPRHYHVGWQSCHDLL